MWLPWLRHGRRAVRDAGGMGEGPRPDRRTARPCGRTAVPLHLARRGQRPLVGLPLPPGRHRGEHPVQVGHDLGPDDLPAARVPRPPTCRAAWARSRPGWTGWSGPRRTSSRCWRHRPTGASSRPTPRSTACRSTSGCTYIVVGRHPLDMAVSLYHHSDNIDRRRMAELTGQPEAVRPPRPPLHEWLLGLRRLGGRPPGLARHAARSDAAPLRRLGPSPPSPTSCSCTTTTSSPTSTAPCAGLSGLLGIPVDEERWPALVHAATFDAMRDERRARPPDPRRC